jgi:hypothetical protein
LKKVLGFGSSPKELAMRERFKGSRGQGVKGSREENPYIVFGVFIHIGTLTPFEQLIGRRTKNFKPCPFLTK